MENKTKTLILRVEPAVKEQIGKLAAAEAISPSAWLRRLVYLTLRGGQDATSA